MTIDVVIEDARWKDAGIEALAERAFGAVFEQFDLPGADFEVAVLACNDTRIEELNGEFRDKNQATNVLSWPSDERGNPVEGQPPTLPGAGELGDIAISIDTCLREANEAGVKLQDHTLHLLVHGILHLFGYDHERERDGDLMEATEIAILERLGVANPYKG